MENLTNKFHLSIDNEYNFWLNYIRNNWIFIDYKCVNCKNNSLKIIKDNKSISNPMKLRCCKKNCKKKINIRKNTFFYFFNKYPISVIIKNIELFIIYNKNVTEIIKAICEYYKINSINPKVIYRMINLIRRAIAHYIKESYCTKLAINNENAKIAKDESLFCHFNGNRQIWLIGLINTNTQEFRIEAVYDRNSEIMEKIIKHHVGEGNFIITDGWGAYSWMDNPNIHGHHDFGHGDVVHFSHRRSVG